jgi:O-antigen ligase
MSSDSSSPRRGLGIASQLILLLMPTLAAVGPNVGFGLAGVTLYAFRLAVVIALPVLLLILGGRIRLRFSARMLLALVAVWTAWGLASLAWTPDPMAGASEVFSLMIGSGAALAIAISAELAPDAMNQLRRGWVTAFVITGLVAYWELRTGRHLQSHYTETTPVDSQGVLISTFGNPNGYAAFLVLAFPFLAWSAGIAKRFARIWAVTLCIAAPGLVVLTLGRLGLVALALEAITLTVLNMRRGASSALGVLAIGVLIGGVVLAALQFSPETVDKVLHLGLEFHRGGSASARLNLMLSGLQFTTDSFGFGTGAGSFERMIESGSANFDTYGAINPHNFWIEILSQYGIIVFSLVVAWLVHVSGRMWRAVRVNKAGDATQYWPPMAAITAMLGYVFAALASSRFLAEPCNWVFLSTLMVISDRLSTSRQEHESRTVVSSN